MDSFSIYCLSPIGPDPEDAQAFRAAWAKQSSAVSAVLGPNGRTATHQTPHHFEVYVLTDTPDTDLRDACWYAGLRVSVFEIDDQGLSAMPSSLRQKIDDLLLSAPLQRPNRRTGAHVEVLFEPPLRPESEDAQRAQPVQDLLAQSGSIHAAHIDLERGSLIVEPRDGHTAVSLFLLCALNGIDVRTRDAPHFRRRPSAGAQHAVPR